MKCLYLLLLAFIFSSCSSTSLISKDEAKWFWPTSNAQSVVIMIHGLNLRPSAMYPLAQHLSDSGHIVRVISLPGHKENLLENCEVSAAALQNYVIDEITNAKKIALENNISLNAVGFSLGGLLLQTPKIDKHIKKKVLIAPATHPKWYVSIMKIAKILPSCWSFPSQNSPDLKASNRTLSSLYNALFDLIDQHSYQDISQTLLVMDPSDSLVSYHDLNKIFTAKNQIILVNSIQKNHHQIFTPNALSPEDWKIVTKRISDHFNHTQR